MVTRYDQGMVANAQELSGRRLQLLEAAVDPQTFKVLDARGIQPGWRCLELGAGRGSVARWLAGRCPDGQVTATDLDPRLVVADGLVNLAVLRHDAAVEDFDPGSFDLIHCRAVLCHIASRDAVLAKMATWLAPGGWLIVEEPLMSPLGESSHGAFQRLYDGLERCLGLQATDMRWARNIGHSIGALGLADIGLTVSCLPNGQGHPWDEMWRVTTAQIAPSAIQQGFLTEDDVTAGLALFDDPTFIDVGFAFVSAWGRRPAGATP